LDTETKGEVISKPNVENLSAVVEGDGLVTEGVSAVNEDVTGSVTDVVEGGEVSDAVVEAWLARSTEDGGVVPIHEQTVTYVTDELVHTADWMGPAESLVGAGLDFHAGLGSWMFLG
jgi:hypothetical protein